jgi:adenylosuccinate lyase
LERTLDDSANRRIILPGLFLATDEILNTAVKVIKGMQIHTTSIERNLDAYGVFAATERLLMELAKRGADRQEMHEMIREHSLAAWAALQRGEPNPLKELLGRDKAVTALLTEEEVSSLLDGHAYVGDSVVRTHMVCDEIRALLT